MSATPSLFAGVGPLEVFGSRVVANEFQVCTVAREAGPVASAQGPRAVADHGFDDCPRLDLFTEQGLVPLHKVVCLTVVNELLQAIRVEGATLPEHLFRYVNDRRHGELDRHPADAG